MQQYSMREAQEKDLTEKYFTMLSGLTDAPFPSPERITEIYEYMSSRKDVYHVMVVVDGNNEVCASGTLVMEQKYIRNLGRVGHIEDIVVSQEHRSKGLGKMLVTALIDKSKAMGAYKTVLASKEENSGFYEKCGFIKKEHQLALYHNQ
ncbi:glucosamine-phosphate N-acetyltransferase [Nematocida sp. LUAm3]|nr:glucosamine-phosphate N-acetyltransferase [Nematocida sp. LUAm3]KAI5173585.1 glucosamine-phosphate N-acetyltransferase [Nematocida sp. LUAm2]KAI5176806.1 glucosamine-phosphate N-acetyltransferase [Nematocida sp. LUAm1]